MLYRMNTHTAVDLTHVVSQIVEMAWREGLALAGATIAVMAELKMEFGDGQKILKMAQQAVDSDPVLSREIPKCRKHRDLPQGYGSAVSRSAEAQAMIEDRADSKLPPSPRYPVLEDGQYVLWDIIPTVLKKE